MAGATSISLSKFTASVKTAVAAAQKRNPKFALPAVQGITVSSLIRGFPVPIELAKTITLAEAQTFADDVAGQIAGAHPELLAAGHVGSTSQGLVVSLGRHIILGIPAVASVLTLEK